MTKDSLANEIHAHRLHLTNFAFNLTKNSDESQDLLQETAYRALVNSEKFMDGTNIKAWLLTIMKNIFINNYRKRKKSMTILDSTDNQFYLNSGPSVVKNDGESNILMDELNGMVSDLDKNIREPFVKHFEGYKYQEIADDMKLPLGTVKSRIFFARQELKNKIEKRYGRTLGIQDLSLKMAS